LRTKDAHITDIHLRRTLRTAHFYTEGLYGTFALAHTTFLKIAKMKSKITYCYIELYL